VTNGGIAGVWSPHLDEAVDLARRGVGEVEPNPPVGAVIVSGGEVVGRGWHPRYGGPHAEVVAIDDAGAHAAGATLVVTLEPCCTAGKTPPCVDAVLAAGITTVVVGATDPNPKHAGRGLALLREAGVDVIEVSSDAARALLERFAAHLRSDRAYVIAKWAATLDGRVATRSGDSKWISGEESRAKVHAMRATVDAIAVGRGTVDADDPRLTARPPGALLARRVVFDRKLSHRDDWSAWSDGGPGVIVVHGPDVAAGRVAELRGRGAELIRVEEDDAAALVRGAVVELREHGVERLLVEGGARLLGSFFDAKVVDRVSVFVAPKVFGGDAPPAIAGAGIERVGDAARFEEGRWEVVGEDAWFEGFVRPKSST